MIYHLFSDEKVDSLTAELEKANELLSLTSKSSPISQQQLAEIFPTAAATSSLLKSGMTLTQVSTILLFTNYSNKMFIFIKVVFY